MARSLMLLSGWILLGCCVPSRAEIPAEVKSLLDRAIKAAGGEANLAKYQASSGKFKGTLHEKDMAMKFSGEGWFHGRSQTKVTLETEVDGQKVTLVSVLDKDKGWNQIAGETEPMSPDELAEAKEEAYASWLQTLVPLKDAAFTLSPLAETAVDGKPAVGIKIASKGQRDVSLYFDKDSALLVKSLRQIKQEETGEEQTEETVYRDYKDCQGTKQAHSFQVKRAGKIYMDAEVLELRLLDKLDSKVFAKPE